MEFKELENKKITELVKILAEEQQGLYKLRLNISVNQLTQIRQVREVRKNIARILTKINELKSQTESN